MTQNPDWTESHNPADPTALPIFGEPAPQRRGRVRGTFSMTPQDEAADTESHDEQPREPTSLRRAAQRHGSELDWDLIATLRQQASERLSTALGEDRAHMPRGVQREHGRAIIIELLNDESAARMTAGQESWTLTEQGQMAKALDDALFGLGRLQPLVDNDLVENIIIAGSQSVWLEYSDGRLVRGPAVATNDQELIDFLVFLASRSESNPRPFSEAQPRLHMRLDGGARLAATAWVHPYPSVVIRRHRLRQVTLGDLVERGTLTATAASFLSAAVKAGKNIVVSGAQGAGKTTLVRALCAEIPRREIIGTFETEYELFLHELKEQHDIVFPWEARPGSGERGADGRQAGEVTLSECLVDSFRFNLSRQIVGEVRGPEILAMFKAMESSNGSISTTHARNAVGALGKLVTCALEAGPQITYDYSIRQIAANVDIVVHVHLDKSPIADDAYQLSRWVEEIITVEPGERETGYSSQTVFKTKPGRREAVPSVMPDEYRDLELWGFDLNAFYAQNGEAAS